MSEIVSFPGLGFSVTINSVAFTIGKINIYWYGIFFAIAFIVGITYTQLSAKRIGIHADDALDVILWAVIGGLIGARAYYVAFKWDMYKDNLIKIFAFREGGLAVYGAVIGASIVGIIVCYIKKIKTLPLFDLGLPGMILAQSIGRWGNFFNCEAFGCNTQLPWGMTSQTIMKYLLSHKEELAQFGITVDPAVPVHPTFFYESVWNLIGFIVIAFIITPKRKYDGEVSLWYLAWYGFGRMIIEGLRTDSLMLGSLRVSQVLAAILFIVSAILIIHFRIKKDNKKVLYVDSDESKERYKIVETKKVKNKD